MYYGICYDSSRSRPHIQGLLDFTNKLHTNIYEFGCKSCYTYYDVDSVDRRDFIVAITFKSKRMAWIDETAGIMDIPTGKRTTHGNSDSEYKLGALYRYVEICISTESRVSQDEAMLFSCILNSLSAEGADKVYNISEDFHYNRQESGILLAKVVLEESGLQTSATIMTIKGELQDLPNIMASLRHNVEKINQSILRGIINLKRVGSDVLELIH